MISSHTVYIGCSTRDSTLQININWHLIFNKFFNYFCNKKAIMAVRSCIRSICCVTSPQFIFRDIQNSCSFLFRMMTFSMLILFYTFTLCCLSRICGHNVKKLLIINTYFYVIIKLHMSHTDIFDQHYSESLRKLLFTRKQKGRSIYTMVE